jgi:hypothetical protein
VAVDGRAIALDRIDHVGRGSQSFIRDRGIERRKIDRPHRLGAEHERIIPHALPVDLSFHRELADAIEARLRSVFDAAVEQVDGGKIARILQRTPQRQECRPPPAVIVLRRPVVLLAGAARGQSAAA